MGLFKEFEGIGKIFIARSLRAHYDKYPNWDSDWREAIGIFLGAAFERQGRSPDYAPAGIDAVAELCSDQKCPTPELGLKVWEKFEEKLAAIGSNPNTGRNPLAPKGTPYKTKKGTYRTNGKSVIECILNLEEYDHNILKFIAEGLKSYKIDEVYGKLSEINGVADKIIPLFLRDFSVTYGLDLDGYDKKDRIYLQPIDIWLKRFCKEVGDIPLNSYWKKHAEFIVETSLEKSEEPCSPELVNMGVWYFSANISESYYRLKKALKSTDSIRKLTSEHLKIMRSVSGVH